MAPVEAGAASATLNKVEGSIPAATGVILKAADGVTGLVNRVNISDSLICRQADAMKRLGLGRVGYKYININDGFFGGRAADGTLLIGCDLTTIPPASLPDREAEEGPQHPAPRPRHSAPARHRLPAGGAIVRTFVRDII